MGKKVILLIFAILAIDQIIKIWIKTTFSPHQSVNMVSGFIQLYYIENRGMAFGATLGDGTIAKYVLSIFRLIAIIGIGWYIRKLILDKNTAKGLIFAVGLVFAGATGNLIDSICYDLIFNIDMDVPWNWALDGEGGFKIAATGYPEMRPNGVLLGSVVDMFQFTTVWPSWIPEIDFLGIRPGKEIFGAIWNFADLSISVGVGLIILKYREFFKKSDSSKKEDVPSSDQSTSTAVATDNT